MYSYKQAVSISDGETEEIKSRKSRLSSLLRSDLFIGDCSAFRFFTEKSVRSACRLSDVPERGCTPRGGYPLTKEKDPSFLSRPTAVEITEAEGTGNTRKRLYNTMLNSIEISELVLKSVLTRLLLGLHFQPFYL